MTNNLINIIFGMKVRQARQETGLTLSEFANQCELSPSYVTEIEKGRKYPRVDKIMRMAEVLHKPYDDLVSIALSPSMTHLSTTLKSVTFQRFPFDEFGLEMGDLVTLLTREPEKASALLHAVLEIGRRYGLVEEDFLRAALRSYQEIHENYFQELEDAARDFIVRHGTQVGLTEEPPISQEALKTILENVYGYELDLQTIDEQPALRKYRAVYFEGKKPRLLINSALSGRQVAFILAREVGYQFLKLKERSFASTPDQINSFQQILNDFKAAYFGGALLMPRQPMLADLQHFFEQATWSPHLMLAMLDKYNVTPEMLFYRFSELIPQFFGVKLHFLRFHHRAKSGTYQLVKQLNMNQLIVPSGIGLLEHYCRRWLSVRLLRDMEDADSVPTALERPHVGVQMSEFVETQDRFLCLGFSREMSLTPGVTSSVIVGFRVEPDLKNTIRFTQDPAIPQVIINETCERCPLTAEQCRERAVEPTILREQQKQRERKMALMEIQNLF
ncbi:MAG: ImmA/IrrE family metallo-endopeptidase [Ardenticatenaceae bacterium]|nr:ImmA/IrrE family metallo-endopeptidase [Anaerolineales bacterium]MCB8938861.1 ImmA/IrrE family metallo-endopeptidase [Ardenticatenaceae bacterium]MCB8974095.1 ImmA/IrrE family metallo-endopeptidase [Ardenticatenaceae bacterium]